MACFIVPLTQAVATTIYRRRLEKSTSSSAASSSASAPQQALSASSNAQALKQLELMLWGGSAMLIVDHIISGELMPVFPFFSALLTEGGTLTMLREMLTVGVPMSLLVTAIWGAMLALKLRKKAA